MSPASSRGAAQRASVSVFRNCFTPIEYENRSPANSRIRCFFTTGLHMPAHVYADLMHMPYSASWLQKRSSGVSHAWNRRYCVLSGNFMYIFKSPSDEKPRRIICVDDAQITVGACAPAALFVFICTIILDVRCRMNHFYYHADE